MKHRVIISRMMEPMIEVSHVHACLGKIGLRTVTHYLVKVKVEALLRKTSMWKVHFVI